MIPSHAGRGVYDPHMMRGVPATTGVMQMVRGTSTVGRRGQTIIPAALRRRFGIDEGTQLVFEDTPEGILMRPAAVMPVEHYTAERKAELLLSNTTDAEDYARAAEAVRDDLGLDPGAIPHDKPDGV